MGDSPKKGNPHRVSSLDHLLPERDLDARPRARPAPPTVATNDVFGEYAIVFNECWPPCSIEYLRWSAAQVRIVTHVLRLSSDRMNLMIGQCLGRETTRITPMVILRHIVRHWRVLTRRIPRFTLDELPYPGSITRMCRNVPEHMDSVLLGIFGHRLLLNLGQRNRFLQQQEPQNELERQKIDAEYRWQHIVSGRVEKLIPWAKDDGFIDALYGEKFGPPDHTPQ